MHSAYADLTHKEWHLLPFQSDYMPTTPREENYSMTTVRTYPNANDPKYVDCRKKVSFMTNEIAIRLSIQQKYHIKL